MITKMKDEWMWGAVLDGDLEGADLRSTRREARADAAWLRKHPARLDRLRNGGGVVQVLKIARSEWTGELVAHDE